MRRSPGREPARAHPGLAVPTRCRRVHRDSESRCVARGSRPARATNPPSIGALGGRATVEILYDDRTTGASTAVTADPARVRPDTAVVPDKSHSPFARAA